ncbi:hypothetical protein [Dactylosporangium sp. CA-233914]|uniref:hypothetical protein n=1 Tax=Dactylosporangium sp. CA-233914 TaxID=3239934 RepID=UPI003D9490FF
MEQRDQFDAGRPLALLVVLADLLLIPAPLVALYDLVVEDSPELATQNRFNLVAWAVAGVPLVAAFVCAVKVFRDERQPQTRRRAACAGSLFVAGLAMLVAAVVVRETLLPTS